LSEEQCDCYCLVQWLNPLASGADVISSSVVTPSFFGMSETETEKGDVVWDAKVRTKKYVCNTINVISESDQTIPLAKHSYTQTRTRTATLTVTGWKIIWYGFYPIPVPTGVTITWGPWSAWTRTNGPANTDKQALSWGSLSPHCPDKNIPCP